MNNKTLTVLFFIFISSCSWTQVVKHSTKIDFNKKYQFKYKRIIIPTVLISYGVLAINNNQLQIFNNEIKEEVGEHIDEKTTIDDLEWRKEPAAESVTARNLATPASARVPPAVEVDAPAGAATSVMVAVVMA